jgi:hypothetical protein
MPIVEASINALKACSVEVHFNRVGNFDNIAQAFIAVFQIFTIENWTLLMNNVIIEDT